MTHYAYIGADLRCPSCDAYVTDMLWFQWGFCPGAAPRDEYIYKVGDPIYWKVCQDGSIAAWVYFKRGEGANIGDPSIKDLIVRDSAQYGLKRSCDVCQQPTAGGAIEIRGGVIQKAWLHKPSELDDTVDIFIIEADGQLRSMPEWNDHPMGTINDC